MHSLVVIHIGEPSRSKKWRLQLFRRKKSIMLPDFLRGYGTYFQENVVSHAGVDYLLVPLSCFPLADREDATLQLDDYYFPYLSACVNPGLKLSLGLSAGIRSLRGF